MSVHSSDRQFSPRRDLTHTSTHGMDSFFFPSCVKAASVKEDVFMMLSVVYASFCVRKRAYIRFRAISPIEMGNEEEVGEDEEWGWD